MILGYDQELQTETKLLLVNNTPQYKQYLGSTYEADLTVKKN
jgi:hypothetical protein